MSGITGKEPKHWHDGRGGHRMPDPRKIYGPALPPSLGSDERAYAEHLKRHERLEEYPEPREGDSPAIRALFEKRDNAEGQVRTISALIRALRERDGED